MKINKLICKENRKSIQDAVNLSGIDDERKELLKKTIKKALIEFKRKYPEPCFIQVQNHESLQVLIQNNQALIQDNKEHLEALKKISKLTEELMLSLNDKKPDILHDIMAMWPSPTNPLTDRAAYSKNEIITLVELLIKLKNSALDSEFLYDYFDALKPKNGREGGRHSNHIFLFYMANLWLFSNDKNKVTAATESNKNKFIDFLNLLYEIIYPNTEVNWERPIKAYVKVRKNRDASEQSS